MTTAARCSVIILNWNGADFTIECYRSLQSQIFKDFDIIIVDNASTDDSMTRLARECPHARLVRNDRNEGTGGGFAFGARQSTSELVLFLCNDTVLEPDALAQLVATMDAHPDCGACGGKHLYYDRPETIELLGYGVDKFGMQYCMGSGEPDSGNTEVTERWISGTVFMARRSAYEHAGGYDPVHFTLNDEVDLCWRLRIHGYRLLNNAAARIRHRHFATLKHEARTRTRYWAERHLLRTLLKNYGGWSLAVILPQYFALFVAELIFLCAQGLFGLAWADLRALGWNFRMLPDTWRHHRRIQASRTVTDRQMKRVFQPGSAKIQWAMDLLRTRTPLLPREP